MSFLKRNQKVSQLKQLKDSTDRKRKMLEKINTQKSTPKKNKINLKEKKLIKPHIIPKILPLKINDILHKQVSYQNRLFYGEMPNQSLQEAKVIDAYIELAAAAIQLKDNRGGVTLVLSWPIGFEWPGLAHALANRTLSASDGRPGMRVALYPSNRAMYNRYKNTYFPSDTLIAEALRCIQSKAGDVISEPSKRHHAFLALNSVKGLDEKMRNPTLRSAIPIFEWHDDNQQWTKKGDSYLKDIRAALRRASTSARQVKIDQYAEIQDNPDSSEDGMYCISKKYSAAVARKLLSNASPKFDLIIFDARQNVLRGIKNWRSAFSKFTEYAFLTDNAPPVVILCDDPIIYSDLRFQIEAQLNKKLSQKKLLLSQALNTFHIYREDQSVWNSPKVYTSSVTNNNVVFLVDVIGKASMDYIHRINKYAKSIPEEHKEVKKEFFKLGGFLRDLIDSPVGLKDTRDWVNDYTENWSASESSRFAARYKWDSYKLELENRLGALDLYDNSQVKKILQTASLVAESIESHTEIQLNIEKFSKEAWNNNKETLIVVPRSFHIELIQKHLSKHVANDYAKLIHVCAQADKLEYQNYKIVIIAGKVDRMIPSLLLNTTFPEEVYLCSSAYGAERIERILKVLVSIPELSKVHSRASAILNDIQPILSSMEQIGYVPGELENMDASYSSDLQGYEPTETYAYLYLQRYGCYPIGKNQTLIKYIPEKFPPYVAVTLKQVIEGDQILVLEDGLRGRMETFLSASGTKLQTDSKAMLNTYFSNAKKNLEVYYEFKTRRKRAEKIHQKMSQSSPEVGEAVTVESITRWIKWIEEHDHASEDEFQSFSAQKILHFTVFAAALNIDRNDAEMYFNYGVKKHRASQILKGRYIGYRLKNILTNATRPELMGLSLDQQNSLIKMANENVYSVEMINFYNEEFL